MIPVYKGIAMFMLCMLPPSVAASAQNPVIEMDDYTSDISIISTDGTSAIQQVGSPLLIPELISGDAQLYQGLFALLSGVSSSSTSISSVFIDSDSVEIYYEPISKRLTVTTDETIKNCMLNVIDLSGKVYAKVPANSVETSIDLSYLPAGTYAAGLCHSNTYIKTLKFIVK